MRRILLIIFSTLSIVGAQAQDLLGIGSSNYGGLSSVQINPANLADNRLKFEIQLFGTGFGVANNFIGFKPSYLVRDGGLTSTSYPLLDPTPATEDFTTAHFQDNRSLFVFNNIYLPGVLISINEKNSISLSGRARTYFNVDGVDEELYRFGYNSLNYPTLYNKRITNDRLSIQSMSWMEYALGFGRVLVDKEKHFLKAGISIKALQGLQSAYLYVDNLDYEIHSDSTLSLYNADVHYGHSSNFEASTNNLNYNVVSNLGIGFDFGVIYEWRPDYAKHKHDMDGETNVWKRNENKYKLKVGVSMTDLGGVKFSKGGQSGDFTANTSNWDISKLDFGTTPIAALDDTLSARFGGTITGANYKMNLPTAFSTQIDYHIWRDLYINQTNLIAFGFNSNPNKVHDFTTISVTPRWDHRVAGVSIPMSYNSIMGTRTGLALRLGPVTFGTSSMYPYRAFLRGDGTGKKDITGADAYVMVRIPIAYKRIKDRDEDKVSDKKDQCKKVPGTWEYRGCPDRDGDHIRDEDDDCPDVPGLLALHGCPDKDGDGITDLKDDCPDIKGLVQFNGCPDTDGDGIIDNIDECPTVFGIAELKGCPPLELTYFNIEIQVEKVRQDSGAYIYANTIEIKTSKFKLEGQHADTVQIVFVTGSNLSGKNAYREADGFFRFAKEAEVVILKEEEEQVIKKAFENLEFTTNSDVILPSSFSSLDELAKLMSVKPTWKLRISGHTDNVGTREANLNLSKRRSESVKRYLESKGVSADRFEVLFFGPDQPIAPNNTEDGRARNRRVEMIIVE